MRKPPPWIIKLKPGKYTTEQLINITGLCDSSINNALIKYGAIVEKIPSGYRNVLKNIYIWKGYKNETISTKS